MPNLSPSSLGALTECNDLIERLGELGGVVLDSESDARRPRNSEGSCSAEVELETAMNL